MQRDARRALGGIEEEIPQEVEVEVDMDESGQLSPVSEEREVEELVSAYFTAGAPTVIDGNGGDNGFDDDPDYDQAFMEMLSQEQGGGQEVGFDSHGQHLSRDQAGRGVNNLGNAQDGDMDMT